MHYEKPEMNNGDYVLENYLLTVFFAVTAHLFTAAFLQGLAALIAIVSGGVNIYYQVKRGKTKS